MLKCKLNFTATKRKVTMLMVCARLRNGLSEINDQKVSTGMTRGKFGNQILRKGRLCLNVQFAIGK